MATNPPSGDNHRNGAVRGRSQTYNPKTGQYVKRDAHGNQFLSEGIKKEEKMLK